MLHVLGSYGKKLIVAAKIKQLSWTDPKSTTTQLKTRLLVIAVNTTQLKTRLLVIAVNTTQLKTHLLVIAVTEKQHLLIHRKIHLNARQR
jgi:hypothetical protein